MTSVTLIMMFNKFYPVDDTARGIHICNILVYPDLQYFGASTFAIFWCIHICNILAHSQYLVHPYLQYFTIPLLECGEVFTLLTSYFLLDVKAPKMGNSVVIVRFARVHDCLPQWLTDWLTSQLYYTRCARMSVKRATQSSSLVNTMVYLRTHKQDSLTGQLYCVMMIWYFLNNVLNIVLVPVYNR